MSLLALPEGTLFAQRYQIVRRIAQGGMGAVYEVIHVETERRRALKLMLPSFLQSEEMRRRFRQEARVTARVESEYIVDVLDAGIDEITQMPFLVMEFLTGEELEKRLVRAGRFEPHEVVTYLQQAALALDKTHKASIVHRDLKPANLFLTEREDGSPRIKILDFGIAKLVAEGGTGGPATQLLGTPLYMAPEQFQLGRKISPASDIFALGMIAYTLLVGRAYWQDEVAIANSAYALIGVVMHGPRELPAIRAARHGVELPAEFNEWFQQVTAIDPEERFHSASSAVVALGAVFGIQVAQRTPTVTGSGLRPVPVAPPPREPSYPPPIAPALAPPPAPRPVEAISAPREIPVNAPRSMEAPNLPRVIVMNVSRPPEAPMAPPVQPPQDPRLGEARPFNPHRQSQPSYSNWSPAGTATPEQTPQLPISSPASMPTGPGVSNTAPVGKRGSNALIFVAAGLGAAALISGIGIALFRGKGAPPPDESPAAAQMLAEPPVQSAKPPAEEPPPPPIVIPSGTPIADANATTIPTSAPAPSALPVASNPAPTSDSTIKKPLAPKPPAPKPKAPRVPKMTFD